MTVRTERRTLALLSLGCEPRTQKLADRPQSAGGSLDPADAADKSMRHPLPHIQSRIDARGDRALDKPLGVGQQHLVIANVDTDRR